MAAHRECPQRPSQPSDSESTWRRMPSDFASHKSEIWQAHLLIITISFLRRRRNVRMRYIQFDCWVLLLSGGMTESDDTLDQLILGVRDPANTWRQSRPNVESDVCNRALAAWARIFGGFFSTQGQRPVFTNVSAGESRMLNGVATVSPDDLDIAWPNQRDSCGTSGSQSPRATL